MVCSEGKRYANFRIMTASKGNKCRRMKPIRTIAIIALVSAMLYSTRAPQFQRAETTTAIDTKATLVNNTIQQQHQQQQQPEGGAVATIRANQETPATFHLTNAGSKPARSERQQANHNTSNNINNTKRRRSNVTKARLEARNDAQIVKIDDMNTATTQLLQSDAPKKPSISRTKSSESYTLVNLETSPVVKVESSDYKDATLRLAKRSNRTRSKRTRSNRVIRSNLTRSNLTMSNLTMSKSSGQSYQKVYNQSFLLPKVEKDDTVYWYNSWDSSPIVSEEFKLVFFTIPKVACTVWKQLMRRMKGLKNWRVQNTTAMIPYDPRYNGLRYLFHYNLTEASRIMTSPEYTRALVVRDPKERFISAYLDKALGSTHLIGNRCCRDKACVQKAQTVSGFLRLAKVCRDAHWKPQGKRIEDKFWPYINFVGHMETLADDAKRLLERVGAWEKYGKSGWGKYGNQSIFQSSHGISHATGAVERLKEYITSPELERDIEEFYESDYSNPWLNLTKTKIFKEDSLMSNTLVEAQ